MTESFEKKCGKYLFEHKRITSIKTKEETPNSTLKKESNESSEINDDNIINVIHSALKKEETISFLCEKQNSPILNKIKEDLNIKQESEDSILISSTILNSSFKNFKELNEGLSNIDIHNIIDIKNTILGDSFLNQHLKKNIKIIKNEIFDTKKNYTNIIQEKKNMIIIKALIYLNKDDTIYNIENFNKREPDLNKSKYEEDNKFEKNAYIRIEDRIREYLNKIKCDKLSQLKNIDSIYIQKLNDFPKKSENYKYLCIKGIIIGLLNIINDMVGKEYLRLEDEQKNEGSFILEIFDKYETMKKINDCIEKDFIYFINNFKEENDLQFNFIDLISDLFWDYVFRIKEINKFFSNNYGSENINTNLNETFDKIVDILIKIDFPYKKIIGEILDISCIKKEKFYLMEYIIKYKNPSQNKNKEKETQKQKEENIANTNTKLNISSISEEKKEIKKEENKEIKSTSDEISNLDLDDKNLNLNLDVGKSLSMDLTKSKLSDKDSLDKVYNYILYGDNESDKKKSKKRHRKRKKNKNNNVINVSEEKEGDDPIVDDFKNFLTDLNSKRSKDYVKKINPKIDEDWLKNINNNFCP